MLLPESSPYFSAETSIFDTLVKKGEEKSAVRLPHQMHLFLVDCLVEHLRDHEITHHVLALGLLRSTEKSGVQAIALLKRTGDAALILAGLFPERALRMDVSSAYFRFMGQAAYASLATKLYATGRSVRGQFYDNLTEQFQQLEKVLNAVRAQPKTEWEHYQRFRTTLQ